VPTRRTERDSNGEGDEGEERKLRRELEESLGYFLPDDVVSNEIRERAACDDAERGLCPSVPGKS